jgi:class 3 adenylate cyclase/tetratricopeptide (TPR) repeat protein
MSSPVTATFVFTDLVDSTATAARLGPEGAEELRQTHFRLLRGAVTSSGGTEVKNLGDGLMVMYSSPSRALSGAVGMAQAIDHHNRSAHEPLGVRIGVSAGEVVEEDDDYFGDPVVEAARLCAAAQGGQILAAELVRLMVGRHATQSFLERGPLELKGLAEPLDVVEVVWEPATVEVSVPMPGRLVGAASNGLFGFFGRGSELEAFTEARKRAETSGQCQAVFVAGEAGMGKTSLVAQATRAAHAEGAVVLFGHSDEGLGVAYQPWIEVLSALVRHIDPDVVAEVRSAQRAALARLVPEVGGDGDRVGDPDTERLLLLEGNVEQLAAVSGREPVMVVLDDLHWADTASLQVLRHVIASSTSTRLTVAITYRDTDLGRGDALNQLLADLRREANVTRLALHGLDDTDIVGLMGAAAGHDLDDDGVGLAHALRRETDGNPFFTAELLRHLGESGGIVLNDDGRWVLVGELDELGLPSSVRDVVGRRVERLGDEPLRVLTLASVIGREFDVDLLAPLAGIGEYDLLDHLDAAVAAALLAESDTAGRYRFTHALTQHSLYDELSPTRRQRAHQRIAEALEAEATDEDATTLAELAHHWVAAIRPADIDKALDYVRRAGDAALDALAPDDAIRWYQQALGLIDGDLRQDELRRAEVLVALGTAQLQAGHPGGRDTLLEAAAIARRMHDAGTLVKAALGFTSSGVSRLGEEAAKPFIQAALDCVGTGPTVSRARLLAALARAHDSAFEGRARRELSIEALDVARGLVDDTTFVDVVEMTIADVATPNRREQVIEDVENAVAMAGRIGDPVLLVRIKFQLIWVRFQQADVLGADTVLAEMEALTASVGLPTPAWRLAILTTGRLLLAGHADQAEAANERSLELGVAADSGDAFGAYGGFLYAIRLQQGRLDEIADMFIDAASDNPSIAVLRAAVAAMLSHLGRLEEAHDRLAAEAAGGFEFPHDLTWLASMSDLLDVAASTGDRGIARVLVDSVAPFADHVAEPAPALVSGAVARPLARCSALLGDYDQAAEWFAIAHDIHERLRAPFWIALGQLDHAELCLARGADGDRARASELVTTAAAMAAEYGCAGLTRRATSLLDTL